MQSDTPSSFSRPVPETIEESVKKEFWHRLRQFYRTSKKEVNGTKELFSPFALHYKSQASAYPFGSNEASIAFDSEVPQRLISNLLTDHRESNRNAFKRQLHTLIERLNQLLSVEPEQMELDKTYDFATEIIAFDKLTEMLPANAGRSLTESRVVRLREILKQLKRGVHDFNKRNAIVIGNRSFLQSFADQSHVACIEVGKQNPFREAAKVFEHEIDGFNRLMRAYRMAMLEVEEEYDTEVHDEYFENFSRFRLTDDELTLFHPIVLFVDHEQTLNLLADLLTLLSVNQLVNIVVINNKHVSTSNDFSSWEESSHHYRLELATLAVAQRNAYLLQSTLDHPSMLQEKIAEGLRHPGPSVFHFLVPGTSEEEWKSCAAREGRSFPLVGYDPGREAWANRFMTDEATDHAPWKLVPFSIDNSEGEATMLPFTYADYKALFGSKSKELMIVPPGYENELLTPLAEFLMLEEKDLYGRIPFIWLADEAYHLYRAAVPNVWVVSCQERLDLFQFIRSMASKAGTSADVMAPEAPKEANDSQRHEQAVSEAVERLIGALLEDEDELVAPIADDLKAADEPAPEADINAVAANGVGGEEEMAWVETDSCTSCNECTDKYPHLFSYNDDKQAYISDARKGTFEELVKAAEKCPAACIHPGKPLNSKEKNLKQLIERASKFNE